MRRAMVQVGVWALATAAAVTLSWFGVRSVLRGTAYDPPRTLPISAPTPRPYADASATRGPTPAPPASTTAAPPAPPHTTRPVTPPRATTAGGAGGPDGAESLSAPQGTIRSYVVHGGRVVLDLGATSASLVSATPNSGWQMRVWTEQGWLRVTFTSASGDAASSVVCTWNGHPPTVQPYED